MVVVIVLLVIVLLVIPSVFVSLRVSHVTDLEVRETVGSDELTDRNNKESFSR